MVNYLSTLRSTSQAPQSTYLFSSNGDRLPGGKANFVKLTAFKVVGSGVSADENITITATGDKQAQGGDITIQGSEVRAAVVTSVWYFI